MNLSSDEIRMVEKLRKRQLFLKRWRIPLLIIHGLLTIAWLVILVVIVQFPSSGDPTRKLILVSYMLAPTYAFLGLSSALFGKTLRDWQGEAKTELLLRVLDELQKTKDRT